MIGSGLVHFALRSWRAFTCVVKFPLLATTISAALLAVHVIAPPATAALTDCAGPGTSYTISNESELQVLATDPLCRAPGLTFTLDRDIELTELTLPWTPIGTFGSAFRGTFNGNGHTITGLSIPTTRDYSGLFGLAQDAVIKNVTLTSVSIIGAGNAVGALVGRADHSTIQDSSVSGDVRGARWVGGAIGYSYWSSVLRVTASSSVSGASEVGGLIGIFQADQGSTFALSDSHATGNVTATGSSGRSFGGLVGELKAEPDFSSVTVEVAGVTASGSVSASTREDVGGLIGRLNFMNFGDLTFRLSASRADGDVTGANRVGGFIGYALMGGDDDIRITTAHATGAVTGTSQVGGFVGYLQEGVVLTDSSATGDVSGTEGRIGGFFGNSDASTLRSVFATGNVTGVGVTADAVGGLGGRISGQYNGAEASISDSYATGTVLGDRAVGGLVGIAVENVDITRTRASGSVTGATDVGGLIGVQGNNDDSPAPGGDVHVAESFATGNVSSGSGPYAGGLVGLIYDEVSITNSYATGSVNGHSYIGGIVGRVMGTSPIVTSSYSSGRLTASSAPAYVGGVLGGKTSPTDGTYESVYWNASTTGASFAIGSSSGGIDETGLAALTSLQMRSSSNFSGWNFSTIWGYQCGVSTTPQLRWYNPLATATSAGPCPSPDPQPPAPSPIGVSSTPLPEFLPQLVTDSQTVMQAPGTAGFVIDGQVIPVTSEPGPRGTGLTLQAGPVEFTLRSQTASGQRVPLAADGSLILPRTGEVPISGDGLEPNSSVAVTLFSDPISLGSTPVGADGTFRAAPVIPSTVPLGAHTLQLTGRTKGGDPFVLSVGVLVETPAAALGADPIISVRPAIITPGTSVAVTARGVQAGCRVTFTLAGKRATTTASKKGIAQALIIMPKRLPRTAVVRGTVSGPKCTSVSVSSRVQTRARSPL